MILLLQAVLVCAGLVLGLPVLVKFLLVLMSLAPRRAERMPAGNRPRVAVLIPAHNERLAIGQTLASVTSQLDPEDRVVVIADNCSDDTAEIARQQGAEVTIRSDAAQRGKGYAMDHGLRFLAQSGPPEVVIFVDADCELNQGCIDRLALSSIRAMRPAQAAYLMNPPRSAQKTAAIVSFAWRVKNLVRPLGWHRLGMPCQLMGSGMAFPWKLVRSAKLASGQLAEDLQLGLDMALIGRFALYCPDAVVTSDVAIGGKPSQTQRARWEHGVIETILKYLPRLLLRFGKAPSLRLLAVALDLGVPPLALLALALGVNLLLTLVFLLATGALTPVIVSAIACGLFFASIILAWWRHGQDIIPLRWLIFAPVYAVLKVPMYGRFFFNRQRSWARGERQLHG